jgi:NAD(P)-dependent dehydrogenase (short-subunit alcohol dehydrogenase family)
MKKTVLITGATGAIGRATAIELAKHNCTVILLGRDAGKLSRVRSEIMQASNNKEIKIVVADLSEPRSVKQAVADIKKNHQSLNALINVAAIFTKDRRENSEGLEYTFATNHLGPFILTTGLIDLLKAGGPARVVTVSAPSTTKVNFDDINGRTKYSSGFMGAFGASKTMNIMFTYALSRRLKQSGITTSVFHPGLVKSELIKDMPKLLYYIFKSISSPPEKAAKMLCELATGKQYEKTNGTFIRYDGKQIQSNKYSNNTELQEKLWVLSEDLSKKALSPV